MTLRPIDLVWREIDILLALPVLVSLFSVYEVGALLTGKWHTISYLASTSPTFKGVVIALFFLGGISGAVWFYFHAQPGKIFG